MLPGYTFTPKNLLFISNISHQFMNYLGIHHYGQLNDLQIRLKLYNFHICNFSSISSNKQLITHLALSWLIGEPPRNFDVSKKRNLQQSLCDFREHLFNCIFFSRSLPLTRSKVGFASANYCHACMAFSGARIMSFQMMVWLWTYNISQRVRYLSFSHCRWRWIMRCD